MTFDSTSSPMFVIFFPPMTNSDFQFSYFNLLLIARLSRNCFVIAKPAPCHRTLKLTNACDSGSPSRRNCDKSTDLRVAKGWLSKILCSLILPRRRISYRGAAFLLMTIYRSLTLRDMLRRRCFAAQKCKADHYQYPCQRKATRRRICKRQFLSIERV